MSNHLDPDWDALRGFRVFDEPRVNAHGGVCSVRAPSESRPLRARMYSPTGAPTTEQLDRWFSEFEEDVRRHRASSPHIVPICRSGRAGDHAWVVSEELPACALSELIARQALPPDFAMELLTEIAVALDTLHANDLVHRALRPETVLVTEDGEIRFADTLLLGRSAEAVMASSFSIEEMACVAPEVVLGLRQRAASNQYSLAAMGYRILTGAWPHTATTATEYAYATVYGEPATLSSQEPGLPEGWDVVFARALATEPDDRYSNCAQLVAALRVVANDELNVPPASAEPVLQWFRPGHQVFEIKPQPPLEEADAPRPALTSVPDPDPVEPEPEPEPLRLPVSDVSTDTPEPRPVTMPDPMSSAEALAAPTSPRMRDRIGRFLSYLRGRSPERVPAHMMREAYLAEWRGNAEQSTLDEQEWGERVVPQWDFSVQVERAGWLRVDGRYAGPAPAEVTVAGRAGDEVLVELMRDGAVVDSTSLKLHPMMDKTWRPVDGSD
ncbi:MAG: protein kinase [Acidobacteria bacterium]|nr:protein kinase [Acidobacteriota bacterium]